MAENQEPKESKWGGKRQGAGRKGLASIIKLDPRYLEARGYNPLFATEILEQVVDERKAWQRLFQSEDDRIVLDALKFLVQMRDGKPAQSISVTSTNVNLNAKDIETARAIVREIVHAQKPIEADGTSVASQLIENKADGSIMLCKDEGGNGGDGVG